MPSTRATLACAGALAMGLAAAGPAAAPPSLAEVLKQSAAYVAEFRRQLSAIAAEESYRQELVVLYRGSQLARTRAVTHLRSDLLLVKATERYVELRDVFEVDGTPVRDREARLEHLLADPKAGPRIGDIISESARYNIGGIQRNINTPLMALQFLDAEQQPRFRFTHTVKPEAVFPRADAITDAGVFRVSTEMWTVAFEERRRPTIIRQPDGDDLPARGRFWINPSDGAVLISEIVLDGGGVKATVTVSYQSEPLMGLLVPVEMRESYAGRDQRITGEAVYGRFRPVSQRAQ